MTSTEIIAIIGSIGVLVTTVFTAWAAFKAKTAASAAKVIGDENKVTGVTRDKKLDNITVLVDGRYGQVLQELADMNKKFAILTGVSEDHDRAVVAQDNANAQHDRTAAASRVIAAGGSVKLPDTKL